MCSSCSLNRRYSYEGPIFLCSENAGVRILSEERVEFLERVPGMLHIVVRSHQLDPIVDIFGIGSTKPAAMLYDAWDHFQVRRSRA